MRKIILTILFISSLILVNSCTIYKAGDQRLTHKRLVGKIKPYHSNKRDIVKWFGDTTNKAYVDRKERWAYSFFERKLRLFKENDIENYYLTIYFDSRTGKVLEYDFYNGDGSHI